MKELTNEALAEMMAQARDPNAVHKQQQARERDAVLAVTRQHEPPPAPVITDNVAAGKERVSQLEARLSDAQIAHAKAFPQDVVRTAHVAAAIRQSEAAIGTIREELDWARRDLLNFENAARQREMLQHGTRLFELIAPDGRRIRQSAGSAESLRRNLQAGYELVAEVFPGGMTRPIDPSQPNLFTDFISAFGPELLLWLSSQGVRIRRDEAA